MGLYIFSNGLKFRSFIGLAVKRMMGRVRPLSPDDASHACESRYKNIQANAQRKPAVPTPGHTQPRFKPK
jgi:hypothetical protein